MRGYCSMRGASNSRHSSGFTLVELIIAIVLIGILGTVGSEMISASFTTTRMVDADTASAGQARYALERLAREIREVKYASSKTTPQTSCATLPPSGIPLPADTDKYCITTPSTLPTIPTVLPSATLPSLVFTNGAGTDVNITGSGTTLNLNNSPLCGNVTSLVLTFSTIDGSALTKSSIRFVVIELTVNDLTNSGQPIQQRTRVALRNA